MFIRSVYFKVGKESGQNSSVVTDKVRIPMFGRIRSELSWLKEIKSEFHGLE